MNARDRIVREGMRFANRKRRAVALFEALVAGSVTILMAAILLPALGRAREQTKLSRCMDNLRQIAAASMTYAQEDRYENAIPVHFMMWRSGAENLELVQSRSAWGGKSGIGGIGAQPLGTLNYAGPATRPLNRIIFKRKFPDYRSGPIEKSLQDSRLDLDIFKCPSDDGYPGGVTVGLSQLSGWRAGGSQERIRAYDFFGNSYSAQQFWVRYIGGNPHNFVMSNSVFLRPLSSVPDPARTVLYHEMAAKNPYQYPRPEDNDPCDPYGPSGDRPPLSGAVAAEVAKGWHKTPWVFTQAFADGRVESLRTRGAHCEEVVGFTGTGCCHCSGGNSSCIHRRIVVRGPRWRRDCLPSSPIRTNIQSSGRSAGGEEATGSMAGVGDL